MKIAFLHTSVSHINRFEKIVTDIDDTIQVGHFVNKHLLEKVLQTGKIDKEGFNSEIRKIKNNKFENIICTCSTYGELCNEGEKVYRIDKPIVELIVTNYSNIGIAFTAKSTKEISKDLIKKIASKKARRVRIVEINCEHCWNWFETGEISKYGVEIAKQIKNSRNNCEVIFLAQASMEEAKNHLAKETYKTVSSPEFGVQKYLELIKKEGCA